MARGGIYDQLGGGFARYSVDAALGGAALREDAVRQRAAAARLPALVAARPGRRSRAGSRWRPPTGCCATCAPPRAGSPPRSTPTARASRASPTSGRRQLASARCRTAWAPTCSTSPPSGTFEHGASVLQLLRDPDDAARWEAERARLLAVRGRERVPAGPRRQGRRRVERPGRSPRSPRPARCSTGPTWSTRRSARRTCCVGVHLDGDRLRRVSRDGVAGAPAGVLEDYGDVAEGFLALLRRDRRRGVADRRRRAARRRARPLRRRRRAGSTTPPTTPSSSCAGRRTPPTTPPRPGSRPRPARCSPTPPTPARTATARRRSARSASTGCSPSSTRGSPAGGWRWRRRCVDGPREVAVVGPATDDRTAPAASRPRCWPPRRARRWRSATRADAPGVPLLQDRPLVDGAPGGLRLPPLHLRGTDHGRRRRSPRRSAPGWAVDRRGGPSAQGEQGLRLRCNGVIIVA